MRSSLFLLSFISLMKSQIYISLASNYFSSLLISRFFCLLIASMIFFSSSSRRDLSCMKFSSRMAVMLVSKLPTSQDIDAPKVACSYGNMDMMIPLVSCQLREFWPTIVFESFKTVLIMISILFLSCSFSFIMLFSLRI